MLKVVSYIVVTAESASDLEEFVQKYLADGYQPRYGISTTTSSVDAYRTQPMVKYA